MTNSLTPFQQELIDAAALTEHKWSLMEEHANSTRENIYRQEYLDAKAKFMELVQRAVDSDKPRTINDDGMWVRIDD